MKAFTVPPILLMLGTLLIGGCSTSDKNMSSRYFNEDDFPGLLTLGEDINSLVLDYDLDAANADVLHFTHCSDVQNTTEEAVASNQFGLWQLLRVNCKAAEFYHQAPMVTKSYFPGAFSQTLIYEFPATAQPDLGGESLHNSAATLKDSEPNIETRAINEHSVEVLLGGGLDVTYVLLARGDFDHDNYEDLLIRLDWNITGAFGHGTDLIMLSKTDKTQAAKIQWRWNQPLHSGVHHE